MFSDTKMDRNQKLISLLLSIPFVYSDILTEQVNCSVLSDEEHVGYYAILFNIPEDVSHLPLWMDAMPLSWQILVKDIPVLFQLFTKHGLIDKLEVIDMGFRSIEWDNVWDAAPMLDFEYNNQCICSQLISGDVLIEKMHNYGDTIDFAIKLQRKCVIACFRNCQIRSLEFSVPYLTNFKIDCTENGKYTLLSRDNSIDFDCSLFFLKLHTIIS